MNGEWEESVVEVGSLIAVVSREQSLLRASRLRQKRRALRSWCNTRVHQVEGGPLLFLMVASEHSASEVSQSESPNCSGFS